MAAAAAAARAGRRRVTHRQGAQGGAWRPATAASRRHEAALTVPPCSAGVSPLVVAARSARTRAPRRVVAAVSITASRGGRGRRGRCRPHSRCVNSISVFRLAGNSGLTESVHADQIQATCSQSQDKFHAASVTYTCCHEQLEDSLPVSPILWK